MDGRAGVMHDGGVLWNETTVQFQARSEAPETVMDVADSIRDVLCSTQGLAWSGPMWSSYAIDSTTSPHYYGTGRTGARHSRGGFRGVAPADVMRRICRRSRRLR